MVVPWQRAASNVSQQEGHMIALKEEVVRFDVSPFTVTSPSNTLGEIPRLGLTKLLSIARVSVNSRDVKTKEERMPSQTC